MLTLKKISTKKLVIYIFIMVLMFGGTGFMLYQNRKTTSYNSAPINNYNELMLPAGGTAIPGGAGAENQPIIDQPGVGVELEQVPDTSVIKNNSEIDSTILESEKFKALKENVLTPRENIGVNKRDLFKPN